MSAFFDALRAQLEPELVCPKCGESNRENVSRQVTLVDRHTAYCSECSHAGPLEMFQPKELR